MFKPGQNFDPLKDEQIFKKLPRSFVKPTTNAFIDSDTLKQCETILALAVTTMNLEAKARSLNKASRRRSCPRCKSALSRQRCVCPAKLIDSTSNSLQIIHSFTNLKLSSYES